MATPPRGAPRDNIIIKIAGAQLHHSANKLGPIPSFLINSLRDAITIIVYRQTDGRTDNGVSHKLDWSRPIELKTGIFEVFAFQRGVLSNYEKHLLEAKQKLPCDED